MPMPTHRPVQNSAPLTESNQANLNTGEAILSEASVVETLVERIPIRLQIAHAVLKDTNPVELLVPLATPTLGGIQQTATASMPLHTTPLNTLNNHPDTTHAHDNRPFNPWGSSPIQQSNAGATKAIEQKPAPQHEVRETTVSLSANETTRMPDKAGTSADNLGQDSAKNANNDITPPRLENESQRNQLRASDETETKNSISLTLQSNPTQPPGISVEETTTLRSPLYPELNTVTTTGDSTGLSQRTDPSDTNQTSHSEHQQDTSR